MKEKNKVAFQIIKQGLPQNIYLIILVITLLSSSLLAIFIPYFLMKLIDSLGGKGMDIEGVLLIITIFLLQLVVSAFSFYIVNKVAEKIVKELRIKIWSHVLQLPMNYFDENRYGMIVSGIINDTEQILEFLNSHISSFISNIIMIIGSIVLLIIIDWHLALLLAIAVPIAVIITSFFGNKEYQISSKYRESVSQLQDELGTTLSKIRLVKSMVSEKNELKKEIELFNSLYNFGVQEGKMLGIISPISSIVVMLLLLIAFGYGTYRISNGSLSNGSFVASIMYLFQLADPFAQLVTFYTNYQKFIVAVSRIQKLLDEPIESANLLLEKREFKQGWKGLCFKDVTFSYRNGEDVLQNVNHEFKLHKTTAIIGESGAGKTTLFSLIERFYNIDGGCIYYCGQDIRTFPLDYWRNKIAYVSQDIDLSYGTLIDNLTYGVKEYTIEQVDDLICDFGLKGFVDSLEFGYNTVIGEKGATISGGQKQRLSLIRAILRKPEIYLLDEPTSALDINTEKLVQVAFDRHLKDKTVLVIAHRLNTIASADEIVILKDKTISSSGTYLELCNSGDKELLEENFSE